MLRHAQLCVVLTCAWLMPMNGRCPMNISLRSTVGSGALHELMLQHKSTAGSARQHSPQQHPKSMDVCCLGQQSIK